DGPGQGEGEYDFPIRGDYEVAVKAVIDSIAGRDDIDLSRLGIWGVSLRGYYAARAPALEKPIKACIALGGPFDGTEAWDGLPELTRAAFRVRSHCVNAADARNKAATLTLKDVAKNIACPICIITGKLDRVIPWQHAERLAREVKGPV